MVALLIDEPGAAEVEALLRRPDARCVLTAANAAEVVDVLVRLRANDAEAVVERFEWLIAGGMTVLDVTPDLGLAAGRIRADHYNRTETPISLGDAIALAAALRRGDDLATADPAMVRVASRLGIRAVPLPDSAGRRPP